MWDEDAGQMHQAADRRVARWQGSCAGGGRIEPAHRRADRHRAAAVRQCVDAGLITIHQMQRMAERFEGGDRGQADATGGAGHDGDGVERRATWVKACGTGSGHRGDPTEDETGGRSRTLGCARSESA